MKIDDYRNLVHEDIDIACEAESGTPSDEFLNYVVGILINGEEFDDFVECHCEGQTRRRGYYCIDGYSLDETDGSCCLFIVDYHGREADSVIRGEDVTAAFKKMRFFVEESVNSELYREISNNTAKELARDLYFGNENITKYRFYLVTDAFNRQRARVIKDEMINGRTVELNVWDIERLFELVSSQMQKESVEIRFSDYDINGIPCVKAVEYENVVADIDVLPTDEKEEEEDSQPKNIISYSSYLAVVPGEILNQLYIDYGAKLLEGNVRSFLSSKGKVNKGIQSTIKNYPEMFFAYNNGIAATATEVEIVPTKNGPVITYIKDLQIVNGGQTTASLTNTLLTAKKGETVELNKVAVPMKLSVLDHSMAEQIIPKISEYSNSQNKVEASDFFSNHPFHIRMEDFSRKTAIPSQGGNQYQQYWFYERARGQYNQGKIKYLNKASELKKYTERYPENMVITMLDLAKYMELFGRRPDIVSKGKQKTLQRFAEDIKSTWDNNNTKYNEFYFKCVVALAIIYKRTDEIIRQSKWYIENRSYKANVIAYTISLIFELIARYHNGYELDFRRIWNDQCVYDELDEQLNLLQNEIHNFITGPRMTENVTEWCKKEACWSQAKDKNWTLTDAFVGTLVSKEEIRDEKKDNVQTQKIANEINALNEIFARGAKYWNTVLEWGNSRKMLSEKEISIIRLSANMFTTGRVISEKQAQIVIEARKRLIENGMPMQFE